MIPLSAYEISSLDGFCEKDEHEQQEWGILVVRFCRLEKEQKNWNEV